jgi:hypothetical protein
MASPTVTYTLANNTTVDANKFNTNYNDILAAMTDGTKTFNIAAMTLESLTISLSLDVNGDASVSGALDVGGNLTAATYGDIIPTTDSAEDIGNTNTRFRAIYADDLYATNGCGGRVDGAVLGTGKIGEYLSNNYINTTTTYVPVTASVWQEWLGLTLTTGVWNVNCQINARWSIGNAAWDNSVAFGLCGCSNSSTSDLINGANFIFPYLDTSAPVLGTTYYKEVFAFKNMRVVHDGSGIVVMSGTTISTSVLKLKARAGGLASAPCRVLFNATRVG